MLGNERIGVLLERSKELGVLAVGAVVATRLQAPKNRKPSGKRAC